jgi:Zn-dependent alcohol dehydrogenase
VIRIEALVQRGEIGGRTVQIAKGGAVECHTYPVAALPEGRVRVRSVRTAVSPGTELSYVGAQATNPYLRKRWDEGLRLFVPGASSLDYPIVFGYRASGAVVESRVADVPVGTRVFGRWRHTEYATLAAEEARAQRLPDALTFDDGVDLAQMAPICINALAHADGAEREGPAVVFGAGPVGLVCAQLARAAGAPRVYVVDRLPGRLAVASDLGLLSVVADGRDVAAELKGTHGADGIAVVFECTGSTEALQQAIRIARRRGLVVAVGFYQGEATGLFLGEEFHHNAVQVRSAQIGNPHPAWSRDALRQRALALALSGDLALGRLPRLTFPIERATDAFAALRRPDEVLQVALAYD